MGHCRVGEVQDDHISVLQASEWDDNNVRPDKLGAFDNVKTWINSIYRHQDPSIAKVLVGNKCDLDDERVVGKNVARKIAEEHGMDYFETSAKKSINIQEMMTHIMDKVYDNLYAGSVEAEVEVGKQSVMLKRGTTSNLSNNSNNQGGYGDCKCAK
eukprot:CAMPEP_0170556544 /NCGR_PEP_ID=MMETSP0211-20121228/17383_1 /TAXON_ID=311385 /ORGANISM="Pseudokeronopsis sp., Strain OXSARD2" /LENGTH=155 /DNA_ID=CAMNT_0010866951 /DNA_START=165 /DNA_END=633 /DNA_ORIENTATION=+